MFTFFKTITDFVTKRDENNIIHVKASNNKFTENQLIRDAFSETTEVLSEDETEAIVNGFDSYSNVNGVEETGSELSMVVNGVDEDSDGWNEEWNAFEENVDQSNKRLLEKDTNCRSINGVVTQVVDQNVIVIDDNNRVKYDVCLHSFLFFLKFLKIWLKIKYFIQKVCSFETPFVGDLVNVESNSKNEVIVKPLRYKILRGRITDYEKWHQRFIFSRHVIINQYLFFCRYLISFFNF